MADPEPKTSSSALNFLFDPDFTVALVFVGKSRTVLLGLRTAGCAGESTAEREREGEFWSPTAASACGEAGLAGSDSGDELLSTSRWATGGDPIDGDSASAASLASSISWGLEPVSAVIWSRDADCLTLVCVSESIYPP